MTYLYAGRDARSSRANPGWRARRTAWEANATLVERLLRRALSADHLAERLLRRHPRRAHRERRRHRDCLERGRVEGREHGLVGGRGTIELLLPHALRGDVLLSDGAPDL